jgi:hypothetical protein
MMSDGIARALATAFYLSILYFFFSLVLIIRSLYL